MKLLGIKLNNQYKSAQYGSLIILAAAALFLSLIYANNKTCASANVVPENFCKFVSISIQNRGSSATDYYPVRVPFLGNAFQTNNFMNDLGGGLQLANNNLGDTDFMSQEINSTLSAGWWLLPSTISAAGTGIFNMYVGDSDNNLWRDNGFYFYNDSTTEYVVVPDSANFNISSNFSLYADVYLTDFGNWICPIGGADDQGYIIDRHINVSGYAIGIECDDQQLYGFGIVNGTKIRSLITAPYGTTFSIELTYEQPDMKLFFDGSLVASGSAVSTGTVSGALQIGNSLKHTWVQNAQLSKNITTTNDIEFRFNFDPQDMVETDGGTNPGIYGGTVADVSGNNHNATYYMNRPQSQFTINISQPTNIGSQNIITAPDSFQDVLNPPFGDVVTMGDQNSRLPFFGIFATAANGMGIPQSMFFGSIATMIGFIIAAITLNATKSVPMSITVYGGVMVSGVVANLFPYYFALAVLMLLIGLYGSSKYLNDGF